MSAQKAGPNNDGHRLISHMSCSQWINHGYPQVASSCIPFYGSVVDRFTYGVLPSSMLANHNGISRKHNGFGRFTSRCFDLPWIISSWQKTIDHGTTQRWTHQRHRINCLFPSAVSLGSWHFTILHPVSLSLFAEDSHHHRFRGESQLINVSWWMFPLSAVVDHFQPLLTNILFWTTKNHQAWSITTNKSWFCNKHQNHT